MLARTDAPHAPWTIVEATDRRYAEVKVFETLVKAMEDALARRKAREVESERSRPARAAHASRKSGNPGGAKEKTHARKDRSREIVA
jgi:hypothetical protein